MNLTLSHQSSGDSSINMACKLIVILAVVLTANAAVVPVAPAAQLLQPVSVAVPARIEDYDAVPQYSFAYDVQDALTGDSKAQYETRNGDIVQGSYSLIEADGTRRIVDYTADPVNGFNAVVSREPATFALPAAPAVEIAPAVPVAPVAAPVAPVSPFGFAPGQVIPGGPGPAPAPAVPESGPDSDVEVIDARSGPLRGQSREQSQTNESEQQRFSSRRIASADARQNSAPLRAQATRLSPEEQRAAPETNARNAPAPAPVAPIQAQAQVPLSYPAYSAYVGAYSSPFAFTSPVAGLTYTNLNF
ncbi:translation initiation factor IF-2 [Microplitis demolitor]|uniref:translation initiation factor IF-2 n=1 Tax=Microplitis demolitor TaxID=69319 RepID=UPI0004CD31C5|nr:translation initiation factor IF-2 [Microplitis demolitor]